MSGFMYILRCADDSYYVGSTRNLEARISQHMDGVGAAYTRRRRPVTLVFVEEFDTVAEAYEMEKRVQGWSRAKREALIDGAPERLPGLSKRGYRRPTTSGRD
ncbi:GIY-YIG nuclease family protein [Gordonia neofelifaecis]|uniref:Excinuclease abc c subunit domain protein n=1 Tax=Gordonia neofelifaecis NRRL B-59395 TaxID=644548 RepID=F1YEV8_9ACTN|nr:GIY-YIG nuclease family protein [Gordonia neofelifaecis]EGD56941.1 excinuclease abc c subunit domain protein [Gordonia neofelifaecis NRRL B-59395]